MIWTANLVLLLCFSAGLPTEAPRVEQQERQRRAWSMTRDLISGTLDVQLNQLRENRLDKMPIYGEIVSMRNHIDALVETEMRDVVEGLAQVQGLPEPQQRQKSAEVREKVRQIVVRLSVERHTLRRRLKMADLSSQIQRLIACQTALLKASENLSAKQETQAIAAIQEQRQVRAAYLGLLRVLGEVSDWGGAAGAGAADGLRQLKAARVAEELDAAQAAMDGHRFPSAIASQRAVVQGLARLLERIEQAQGLVRRDRENAAALAQDLIERQERLRAKTGQTPLGERIVEDLMQQQSAIHKDVERLAERLGKETAAVPLLEKARVAAFAAVAHLFDVKQAEALAEQGRVLDNLALVEERLNSAPWASAPQTGSPLPKRQSSPSRNTDNRSTSRSGVADFRKEAWFGRLPQEMRQDIEARAQRPPPRGYEQRMQRYFQNIE